MFNFMSMMGNYEQRKVENTSVDGGVVDTARVTDSTQPYETGIEHPAYNNGAWVIVELYPTKAAAIEGHQKWVKHMESKPEFLCDVNECEIAQFATAIGVDIHGKYYRQQSQSSLTTVVKPVHRKDKMDKIKLGELLNSKQLVEVQRILNSACFGHEQARRLTDYFGTFRDDLEAKGMNPEFLAHIVVFGENTMKGM